MKHPSIQQTALALLASFAIVGHTCADDAKPVQTAAPNQPAPTFTLPNLDGSAVSIKDYQGKIVVLEWTNYDCPFVKKHYETGRLPALQKKLAKDGVVWLSVCSSAPGKQGHFTVEQWKARMQAVEAAPAAVLLDVDGTVGRLYEAKNTPHMVVIDAEGVVRYIGAIDDQRGVDRSIMDQAKNYVVLALEAIQAGKPVATQAIPAYGCSVKY